MTQNCGLQVKYIDDILQMASINLKKSLVPDQVIRPRPRNYNESKALIMQQELN